MQAILFVLVLVVPATVAPASGDGVKPKSYFEQCNENYNPRLKMLGTTFKSPGYHSQVPDGTWVHTTRGSLQYAVALLRRGEPGDAERAADIVAKIISLQDTDPASRTYGIWSWLLEEPLDKMAPPDWNWADFCGAIIAQMLVDHADVLPEELIASMRSSLGHAARAIRKRNVGPNYTNIAIMGGGVCAATGELLDDAGMLDYGRQRLRRCVEHTKHHGGFNEYNSPTYTCIALYEAERTLHLVRDPATRKAAEFLRRAAWEVIAGSFHPATGQWAGPHGRAYHDRLSADATRYLSEQTGVAITPHPSMGSDSGPGSDIIPHLPCPKDIVARFRALPSDPVELRRQFIRGSMPDQSVIGTTWHTADACLGTVNRSTFWTQRHPIIGYWRTDADPAVVFRVRFLHDDRDFASMAARITQQGGRALIVFGAMRRWGDWHPTLDRPTDGVFRAKDLRVRFELQGKGVLAESLGVGLFALVAGGRRVVIHTATSRFDDCPVQWELGQSNGRVFVDGICHHGDEKAFAFREPLEIVLAAGIELLTCDEPTTSASPTVSATQPDVAEAAWPTTELKVSTPMTQ